MNPIAFAVLAFVTAQRIGELVLSARNTRLLLNAGAREVGARHYPFMVVIHATWLAALWWQGSDRPVSLPLLLAYLLLQVARVWVIATLGRRWTTRIIVLPDAPLVRSGPYRLVQHPNYLIVVVEIALLPLVFGLWEIALIFTLLNGGVLGVRLTAENKALAIGNSTA